MWGIVLFSALIHVKWTYPQNCLASLEDKLYMDAAVCKWPVGYSMAVYACDTSVWKWRTKIIHYYSQTESQYVVIAEM